MTKTTRATEALEALTARVIEAMDNDPGQWTQPWSAVAALPYNGTTGRRYNGTNILLLSMIAGEQGYTSNAWGTYKQWEGAGCQVRKGERSSVVVFYKQIRIKDEETDEEKRIPLLRYSSVFAAEQVDGELADKLTAVPEGGPEPVERAEAFFEAVGARVVYGGDSAHFAPGADRITLPPRHTFDSVEGFYSTVAHEHTHWTGHGSRLDRTKGKRFGDDDYAREELVAELGSVFLLAHLGLVHEPDERQAAYLAHWSAHLKQAPRDLWAVVGDASRAFDFLCELAAVESEEVAA